jgi:hypothetical protein
MVDERDPWEHDAGPTTAYQRHGLETEEIAHASRRL